MIMNNFGNKTFMHSMGGSKCLDFFPLGFGEGRGRGRIFFIFPLFSICSLQVPIRFPRCSGRLFPIAPQIYPTS
jgi:hypothetical protein